MALSFASGGGSSGGASGPASGDLTGSYPAPTVKDVSLLTTKGDLLVRGAAAPAARLPIGTTGYVLTADSTKANGLGWAQVTGQGIAGAPNNNRKGLKGTGDWSSDPYSIMTQARGFLIESVDLALTGASSTTAAAMYAIAVGIPAGTVLTGCATFMSLGSASVTHYWYALYDASFNQVSITADSPGSVTTAANNTFVSLDFTAPLTVANDTLLYAVLGLTGANITTLQASLGSAFFSRPFAGNAYRGWTQTGITTALPATATPVNSANMKWLGLY